MEVQQAPPTEAPDLQEHGPDREMVLILRKGQDFESLFKSSVYRRICDWMEARANSALKEIRDANCIEDDRVKANRQLKWSVLEKTLDEFQMMVQDAIHEKERLIDIIKERTS
jgi:hypothetical protein